MSSKIILVSLLLTALLIGAGFWVYYQKYYQEYSVIPSSSNESIDQSYFSKIKVIFTDEIYPPDTDKTNPRLKRYVGKVQNTGDKTLLYVNIKVEYLDKDDKKIKEDNILVNKILKPNFIEEFQFGGLNVPSDWSGKVSYQINEFKFEGSEEIQKFYPSYYEKAPLERPLQQILFFP